MDAALQPSLVFLPTVGKVLVKGPSPEQTTKSSDLLTPCPEQIKILRMADSVERRQTSNLVLFITRNVQFKCVISKKTRS
jgi:hypothetical protein